MRGIRFLVSGCTTISGIVAVSMTFLITTDVIMRQLFNSPIPSVLEVTEGILMPYLIFLAFAGANHVRVTVGLAHMAPRLRRAVISFGLLLSIVFFTVMTWQSVHAFTRSISSNELKEAYWSFPVAIGRFAVVVGLTMLVVVLIQSFVIHLREKEVIIEAPQEIEF